MLKRLLIIIITILLFGHTQSVVGQSFQTGLQIAPAISEIALNPGDSEEIVFRVQNTGSQPAAIELNPRELFSPEGLTEEQTERYDSSAWITLNPSRMLLAGGEEREVVVTVSVPSNASPGGHYATLSIRAISDQDQDVKNVPEINAILFITVSGEINEQLTFDQQTQTPFWQFAGQRSVTVSVFNQGNVHVLPRVEVRLVKDAEIIHTLSGEPQIILPQSSRQFEFDLSSVELPIGVYGIEYVVNYGSDQDQLFAPATTIVSLPQATNLYASFGALLIVLILIVFHRRLVLAWSILTSPDTNQTKLANLRALMDRDIVPSLSDSEVKSVLDEIEAGFDGRKRVKTTRN